MKVTDVTNPSPPVNGSSNEEKKDDSYWFEPPPVLKAPNGAQHGVKGVYYGGSWLDIEDCDQVFVPSNCASCENKGACPRSKSRNAQDKQEYDVLIDGAGCIGGAVARELSRYNLDILWVEAADDVSQGARKGNSGIVHAGYDDTPGTNRAKYCWRGNQMFAQLDRELRFGYQKNGSLVVAFNDKDREHLEVLKKRGDTNGVQFLRIIDQDELRRIEPSISRDAVAALYSPEAGNVIPYVRIVSVLSWSRY
jgi:glycerol-3-phosphate dehydrogenase